MARKPSVRYFSSRKAFYCQIDGVQNYLGDGPDDSQDFPPGPNYEAARRAFLQLVSDGQIDRAGNDNTVKTVCNAYLNSLDPAKVRPATIKLRHSFLAVLVEKYGTVKVADCKPWHLTAVMEEKRKPRTASRGQVAKWGTGSEYIFVTSVKAAFRWALDQELISRNPFGKVKPPRCRTKARERIITPEEHGRILAELRKGRQQPLHRIIVALENTGARPSELCNARVGDWHDELGAIVYYGDDSRREDEFAHKTSAKGKERTIRFTGEALAMVRGLVKDKKKSDLLFPKVGGAAYVPKKLGDCFRAVRERLDLPHLVPYAYRHTLATNWLTAGGSVDVLAELLGNSADTIRKHYSHLCQQHSAIRAQLEAFRGTSP